MGSALSFPDGFWWGAATAAHQIEGRNYNSDWWWAETHGRLPHRSGDACNSWDLYQRDIELLRAIGANAYRFSVEWARIEPEPGRYDQRALDRYRALLEALVAAEIEPVVTLHHFTNPLWLTRHDLWTDPSTARRFASYAERVGRALGDLVAWWVTINEPNMAAVLAYLQGIWPPFRRRDALGYLRYGRISLLAHAGARQALQAHRAGAQAGIAFALWPVEPSASHRPPDRLWAALLDWFWQGRMLKAAAPELDWLGVNYYSRKLVSLWDPFGLKTVPPGARTDCGWEIYPRGLFRVLRRTATFGKPVIITENGIADDDDDQRPAFIVAHLREAHRALLDGVDLRGYFYWTLLDNFEWEHGYTRRFGLAAVDPSTQARRLRPSAAIFSAIARANALPADLLSQNAFPDGEKPLV
jgi:beta-glucosidase